MTTTTKTPPATEKTEKSPVKPSFSKKEVRLQIAEKLETALGDLKSGMGEKKFKSRIKKASKLFSDHYAPAAPKKKTTAPKKKVATKASPSKKAAKKATKAAPAS